MNQPPMGGDSGVTYSTTRAAPPREPVLRSAPRTVRGSIAWAIAVALGAAGLWVTSSLAEAHRFVDEPTGLLGAVCSPKLGEGVNCDQVLQTKWAYFEVKTAPDKPGGKSVPLKLPIAWFGMAYFAGLTTWFLLIGQPSYSRRAYHVVPLAIVGVGCCASAFYLYLMLFKLPAICPLCVTTHVINFGLLACAILLWPRRAAPELGVVYVPRPHWKLVVATCVLAFVVVSQVFVRQRFDQASGSVKFYKDQLAEFQENPRAQWEVNKMKLARAEKREIPVDADDPILGRPDATHTLVMFGDFQCPACRKLHEHVVSIWPTLEQIAEPRGGIRFVFKHYPLYSRCNPYAKTNLHAFSCEASRAAEAARILGGPSAFWKVGQRLYEHQAELYEVNYADVAKAVIPNLDAAAFDKAMQSPEAAERVARHVEQGHNANMSGTPGLYLDGVPVRELAGFGTSVWRMMLSLPQWPPTERMMRDMPIPRGSLPSVPSVPATRP